jgi:phage-related protein
LPDEDRKIIGDDLRTLEFGWPLGMPLCRSISSRRGLCELRSNLTSQRIARMLFCISEGRLLVLHGFIKKSRKAPAPDLDLALSRMKEVLR